MCGAVVLIPLSVLVDHPWTIRPTSEAILALLALALRSTALALLIYFRLVASLGSIGVTAQAYLRVPIGVAISILALGERLTSTTGLGLLCIIIGVIAIMTQPDKQSPQHATHAEGAERRGI